MQGHDWLVQPYSSLQCLHDTAHFSPLPLRSSFPFTGALFCFGLSAALHIKILEGQRQIKLSGILSLDIKRLKGEKPNLCDLLIMSRGVILV